MQVETSLSICLSYGFLFLWVSLISRFLLTHTHCTKYKMSGSSSPVDQDLEQDNAVIAVGYGGTEEDQYFDKVVGALEKIVLSDEFRQTHEQFCRKHCTEFDDENEEENKLCYTDIFERYTSLLENMLEQKLEDEVPNFDMGRFQDMLSQRGGKDSLAVSFKTRKLLVGFFNLFGASNSFSGTDELNADIFDLLMSLGDFEEFKSLMISYKVGNTCRNNVLSLPGCNGSLTDVLQQQLKYEAEHSSTASQYMAPIAPITTKIEPESESNEK